MKVRGMSNKIFIDSCILIEYIKGSQTELLDHLINSDFEIFYNTIVASEFIFHFLAHGGGKSPLSIKENREIKKTLENTSSPFEFISQFSYLNIAEPEIRLSVELMGEFNLLPNDALIIANASKNAIPSIATYDSDFSLVCNKFNIKIANSVLSLKEK